VTDRPLTGRAHKAALGTFGETYASHFLAKRGYNILGRNLRFAGGEIDILAEEGSELVFIEVKTRSAGSFAGPEEAITDERMSHLEAAIEEYLAGRDRPFRIEIVAVEVDRAGRVQRCEVLTDVGLR
jgi:putative endonuclease